MNRSGGHAGKGHHQKALEGHPNVVDVIRDGTVDGVVNTVTGGRVSLRDGLKSAAPPPKNASPVSTSLDTAGALADVLADGSGHPSASSPCRNIVNGESAESNIMSKASELKTLPNRSS